MATIISVINQKGGVGKTTSSLNIAAAFAKIHKRRTLLIDLDCQCALTSLLIPEQFDSQGVQIPLSWSIYDAFVNPNKQAFVTHINDNLDFLPASEDMACLDMEINGKMRREFLLAGFLDKVRDMYDIIILDCPPSLGLITINIFACSDRIIVPVAPELLPARCLRVLQLQIDRVNEYQITKDLKVDGIFFTLFDGPTLTQAKTRIARQIVTSLGVNHPDKILQSVIHRNITLQEFPTQGSDIFEYQEKMKDAPSRENSKKESIARACSDYAALTEELIEKFKL